MIIDGGTFEAGAFKEEALAFAKTKAVTPEWHQIFLKGILCKCSCPSECNKVHLHSDMRDIRA